jgi:hypothetical protein
MKEDKRARDFLSRIPEDQLACRAQGHSWPKIRPDRELPRGTSAARQRDGAFQVRETCAVCGTVRTWTTLPGGAFNMDVQYRYEHPQDWVTREQDLAVYGRDYKAELWGLVSARLS